MQKAKAHLHRLTYIGSLTFAFYMHLHPCKLRLQSLQSLQPRFNIHPNLYMDTHIYPGCPPHRRPYDLYNPFRRKHAPLLLHYTQIVESYTRVRCNLHIQPSSSLGSSRVHSRRYIARQQQATLARQQAANLPLNTMHTRGGKLRLHV